MSKNSTSRAGDVLNVAFDPGRRRAAGRRVRCGQLCSGGRRTGAAKRVDAALGSTGDRVE